MKLAAGAPAAAGAVVVWSVFALVAGESFRGLAGFATILNAAAPLAILAVAVALLMMGGEFDLSIGSVIGVAGMTIMLLTQHFAWALWPALVLSLCMAAAIGAANGFIVVRTGLPSFIVTLGTLFILRGLAIAVPRLLTRRTQLGGLDDVTGYDTAALVFGNAVIWCIAIAAGAGWLLARTRAGNWILATGGNADAARRAGVPVTRVKLSLFVSTAVAAWLVAVLQVVHYTGADALRGEQQEFRAIIAAVIGGTLLTGGYGSALGALSGALIFGMVQQGIVITGIDADWFQVFLGAMLLVAVLVNNYTRKLVLEAR